MRKIFLCLLLGVMLLPLYGKWWEDGSFDWKNAERLCRGIEYINVKKSSPRIMNMWFMRVDLRQRFTFLVSKRARNFGKAIPTHKHLKIHTRRQSTVDFLKEARKEKFDMLVAVNAPPWIPWDRIPSQYASGMGLLVSDGQIVSPIREDRPSLVIYRNGKVDIKTFRKNENISNVNHAVSGFFMVLSDGKSGLLPHDKSLAPRTGIGLSKNRNILYIVVIDGRQSGFSMGSTVDELGHIMKYIGAHDGINMDGGGSSSLVIWNERKKQAVMLNHQPKGAIRPVGASLGIVD